MNKKQKELLEIVVFLLTMFTVVILTVAYRGQLYGVSYL